MENKLDCNRFEKCRKYTCKSYQDFDNKLWYCLVKSHGCEKIMNKYHILCECISKLINNLIVRYKNGKKMRSLRKSRKTSNLGYEYIPAIRPPGGYLRYALLMNLDKRNEFKNCLKECLRCRREHHSMCEFPSPLVIHYTEMQYLQDAIRMLNSDVSKKIMKNDVLAILDREIQDIKNIISELDTPEKSLKNYKKLLELRQQNKINFELNYLCGWITDNGIEFRVK